MNKPACLIVDDEPVNLLLLREYLTPFCSQIYEAANGVEALKIIHKEKIDVVFTDINMPVLNGIELARYIRSDIKNSFSNLPIIAVTAFYYEDLIDNVEEAGFNFWIQKPFNLSKIKEIILHVTGEKSCELKDN